MSFITGVVDIGDKFITGVADICGHKSMTGVGDSGDKSLYTISPEKIFINSNLY